MANTLLFANVCFQMQPKYFVKEHRTPTKIEITMRKFGSHRPVYFLYNLFYCYMCIQNRKQSHLPAHPTLHAYLYRYGANIGKSDCKFLYLMVQDVGRLQLCKTGFFHEIKRLFGSGPIQPVPKFRNTIRLRAAKSH